MDANDETTEVDAVETTDPAGDPRRSRVDGRTLGLIAAGVVALVLAFAAGSAVGGDDGDRHGRGELRRDGGGPGFAGDERRGGGGMRGERGGQGGPRGMAGGGMRGGHGGGMRGGHGGGMGVVTGIEGDELTIEPLGGPVEEVTAALDDDTEIKRRGDDGAGDIEDAERSDLDEGDIVAIRGDRDDDEDADGAEGADDAAATVDADTVVILRDAE
ncbi:MAG: hypothetical protein JWM86_980 [Thermoleophilia bacterium]|nr:hypothetical protein [Thermoleophilia bacterium]